jgi:hypothetical protein
LGLVSLLLAPPASAKGPLEVELVISGGDLERDIRIPADVVYRAQKRLGIKIFGYIGSPTPDPVPPFMYRIDYVIDPTEPEAFNSYLYYPGHDGQSAVLRDPACAGTDLGCWGQLPAEFDAFLRAYLAGTPPLVPTAPGEPLLEPLAGLALMLGVVWLVRRPRMRKRIARLAY